MKYLFWILTLVGGLVGAGIVIDTQIVSTSAPQQAAGAALGVAFVFIPYCIARAIEGLKS